MRNYRDILTADVNQKGVLDVDTVKGCTAGMSARPGTGCYGGCYAAKIAKFRGFDFSYAITRTVKSASQARAIERAVAASPEGFFRIGVMGDPCHAWEATVKTVEWLCRFARPVVITKHWRIASDDQLARLAACGTALNTSISALDTPAELKHRRREFFRFKLIGGNSVARIVSCDFDESNDEGARMKALQDGLFALLPTLDNPLRVPRSHPLVSAGVIRVSLVKDLESERTISLSNPKTYIGHCAGCPDVCGIKSIDNKPAKKHMEDLEKKQREQQINMVLDLVTERVLERAAALPTPTPRTPEATEFIAVESVTGSGYEKDVAKLAIEDGIAMRAARKNMQRHSAIILKIDGAFAGFMTFQKNHECREFCLLQSVIHPSKYTPALYRRMVEAVIAQNTDGYIALITTDPKSKFETPKLFESLGFANNLIMSGFHYMVKGDLKDARMKILAHITMTNVWNTTKGDWLRLKREWNERLDAAGAAKGVTNPAYATRDGCWQGENGYSNVVNTKRFINDAGEVEAKTKAHNGNASVLDPVACEVILRFFMPTEGHRIYNPFGGGVQFGFVAGSYGYEYVASEIRQNQCDANNKLCEDFASAKWVQADSASYEPEGEFDLVFTCPPYYKVETYLDYDGKPPVGEINSCPTYEEFRELLFSGYRKAIAALKDNRFIAVMTGDSRDKNGAYHCSEAETEIFLRDQGLSVYNKIVYLECEFTRLAHAKTTLNYRKFPKREQKIIVAYKGDIKAIRGTFPSVGRL